MRGRPMRSTAVFGYRGRGERLEPPSEPVWTRRDRCPSACELGGSSAWWLGGLMARQLAGPVADAPEVNLRHTARDRTTKPSRAGDAQTGLWRIPQFPSQEVSVKKVIPKNLDLDRGCDAHISHCHPRTYAYQQEPLHTNNGMASSFCIEADDSFCDV